MEVYRHVRLSRYAASRTAGTIFLESCTVSWIEFLDRNLIHTTTMSDIINTQFEYVCFDRWLGYDVR